MLAIKLGVEAYNVSNWETRGVIPSPDTIGLLEEKLGVGGLLLPEQEFIDKNGLYEKYPEMEYFPTIISNVGDTYGIFEEHLQKCLRNVTKSVHYTRLCEFDKREDILDDADPQYTPRELQQPSFLDRLVRGNIIWERAEIFYSTGRLIQALKSLILLRGTRYEIRFYPTPLKSFPIINLRSFDHKKFLIGGYDPERVYHKNCIMLSDREPLRDFFINYWNAVWVVGRPERLTFKNSDMIAKNIDEVSESEWQNIKTKIIEETKPLVEKTTPSGD